MDVKTMVAAYVKSHLPGEVDSVEGLAVSGPTCEGRVYKVTMKISPSDYRVAIVTDVFCDEVKLFEEVRND